MTTIEEILKVATGAEASDVHLTVGISPKMRVNGNWVTMNYPKLLASDILDITLQIMKPFQREKLEACGECDMSFEIPDSGRYRACFFKQSGNVALTLRVIKPRAPIAEHIGLPEEVIELYKRSHGLVLITGPVGSGKTTTAAALIDKINRNREVHVITIEDPIEYTHCHDMAIVNQREVGSDSKSYETALKMVLRENPDVIFIGELKGAENIEAAITVAELGVLVLTTMNIAGDSDVIEHMVGTFEQHQQNRFRERISKLPVTIVTQQLVWDESCNKRVVSFKPIYEIRI